MKIFLCWSGERGRKIAEILRDWLPKVVQNLKPWISDSDIKKGKRWVSELMEELKTTEFGIICLTPENLEEPWILFEAGALSKALDNTYVCPLLFNLDRASVKDPLAQFQMTELDQGDMLKLLKTINGAQKNGHLDDRRLEEFFKKWWEELEQALKKIPPPTEETEIHRSNREILEEILLTVRNLERQNIDSSFIHALSRPLINKKMAEILGEGPGTAINYGLKSSKSSLSRSPSVEPDELLLEHIADLDDEEL